MPTVLSYPTGSVSSFLFETAKKFPSAPAILFEGKSISFSALCKEIDRVASGLVKKGIQSGDRVMICMPNIPQAAVLFYAVNRIGGVAVMAHPLLSAEELAHHIKESRVKAVCTLDLLEEKFRHLWPEKTAKLLIVAKISEHLPPIKRQLYSLTKEKKKPLSPLPADVQRIPYQALSNASPLQSPHPGAADEVAAILYSGGTTGVPKGILLTNKNFNALAMQTAAAGDCIKPGHLMLGILPLFHGFGLGICLHTVLVHGCAVLLVPKFSVKTFATCLKKAKPNYIAGVPTLFEALLRADGLANTDLSFLEGVFCGGDSLSPSLKDRVDAFLSDHGAKVQIREGYGTTECVTASCLTPKSESRRGSIGLPFPDTRYCICQPGTITPLPPEEEGEICLSGPTVMQGYDGHPEETERVLLPHEDGEIYLHTGDLGKMDRDGYVYFLQRRGRLIISSGYNIYPSQIEEALDHHPDVWHSAVIGLPDVYKGQRVKAFVVPKKGISPDQTERDRLMAYLKNRIARYALPSEIEFRTELPKTAVGKIDTKKLERESIQN